MNEIDDFYIKSLKHLTSVATSLEVAITDIGGLKNCLKMGKEFTKTQNKIKVKIDDKTRKEILKLIGKVSKMYKENHDKVEISIIVPWLRFEEAEYLKSLQVKGKIEIKTIDMAEEYKLDDIVRVQAKSKKLIEFIKNKGKNLSPLEKFILIYEFVANREYKMGDVGHTRSVYGVLKYNDIVCVGYARLLEYLCAQAGIKDMVVMCQTVKDTSDKFSMEHKTNLVYIKDKKYEINGWYYADSCWDSSIKKVGKMFPSFNYCLVNAQQVRNMPNNTIETAYDKSVDDLENSTVDRVIKEFKIEYSDTFSKHLRKKDISKMSLAECRTLYLNYKRHKLAEVFNEINDETKNAPISLDKLTDAFYTAHSAMGLTEKEIEKRYEKSFLFSNLRFSAESVLNKIMSKDNTSINS